MHDIVNLLGRDAIFEKIFLLEIVVAKLLLFVLDVIFIVLRVDCSIT